MKKLFYVKWNISDFNKELESDDVEFWLNKEYEEKFNFLIVIQIMKLLISI